LFGSNQQLLMRLLEVCEAEGVNKTDDGLEAILFTAEGDMRQAINNLQSTHSGCAAPAPAPAPARLPLHHLALLLSLLPLPLPLLPGAPRS
jgi:hypothetical protein